MINLGDIYKVVVAMAPLYFALLLGYGSVRWWKIFNGEQQCEVMNKFVYYFILPLFTLDFSSHIDPFHLNFSFLAADAISKLLVVLVLTLWANCTTKGSYSWSITSFSLCTLSNTLVLGVPLTKVMYGQLGVDLVVQSAVAQSIVWLTMLTFVLEFRRVGLDLVVAEVSSIDVCEEANLQSAKASSIIDVHDRALESEKEGGGNDGEEVALEDVGRRRHVEGAALEDVGRRRHRLSFKPLIKKVLLKLAANPNSYIGIVGLTWAFISKRWNIQMPSIVEGSIVILSKTGIGTIMFNMGIFMAIQKKFIACGFKLTLMGMVMRFIVGSAVMAIASIVMGLHDDVLRIVIIQAALPQSVAAFNFAKEYRLHTEVISTAVVFGTLASLPLLVAYYAVLEFVH